MLRGYHIIEGKLVANGAENASVLVYINPDDKEKSYLINQLQIDEHTLNSCLDPDEVARLEFEANHTALIIKRPKRYNSADNFLLKISSIGLFLFSDKVIVVMPEEAILFDGRPFSRLRSIQDMLLKTIFRCIQHFEDHLNVIHKISDELEHEINTALTNKDLLYMFNIEKSLVYYLKAISSNSKVIEKLKTNAVKLGLSTEDNEFLEDVIIENTQCYEEANTYSQVLSSMMDAWVSLVNNNLNIRIKTLTILSICIMLPTLIVSIFSMNLDLPILQHGSMASFWVVLGLAGLSVITIVLLWRYRKW
ncbi:MAG: magnesium transporter CorA family protein [Candidatus Omnitrophica bacterium]|nr:magnesium transporter CorA family protein [Candidatus Omnitrophota bacterium]